ncbi:hypothetical protein PUR59_26130, partial [Streptomyces sp. SP18ES09]|nr:hypothetical protein [Streptomyces sp. SP18ES09]
MPADPPAGPSSGRAADTGGRALHVQEWLDRLGTAAVPHGEHTRLAPLNRVPQLSLTALDRVLDSAAGGVRGAAAA